MSLFLAPSCSLSWTPWVTFQSGMGSKPCRQTGLESAPAAILISNLRWISAPFFLFIHQSCFLWISQPSSTERFLVAPRPQPPFFISFSPSIDCLLYFRFCLYSSIKILLKNLTDIRTQLLHPSASGNLHKQKTSQTRYYWVLWQPLEVVIKAPMSTTMDTLFISITIITTFITILEEEI